MEIGGYFTLELDPKEHYLHKDGIMLNSGRHALEYVLKTIPQIDCIYLPDYTCRVVKLPIEKLGIKIKRYEVSKDMRLANPIELGEYDYLLFTNYFGILDSYIVELSKIYGDKLIVDNAQALFARPIDGVRTAYSPRKFIGVADGGIAYSPTRFIGEICETDISVERSNYLLSRFDYPSASGYVASKESNKTIESSDLKWMSHLTKTIYQSVNFDLIKSKRKHNFEYLHQQLGDINQMNIPTIDTFECPMVYPLFVKNDSLLKSLIEDGIFVAVYWPYVLQTCPEESTAYELAKNVIALPIDQRYGLSEMEYIVERIKVHLRNGQRRV